MKHNVNLSIQVVPVDTENSYHIVDQAIEVIQKKKIKHIVGPFSTSLEGDLDSLLDLIQEMKEAAFDAGAAELLLNIQIHAKKEADVTFESKIAKFNREKNSIS